MNDKLFLILLLFLSFGSLHGQGLIINGGANLVADSSAYLIIRDGQFINNGNLTAGKSTVVMEGAALSNQSIIGGSSTSTFYNLNIAKNNNGVQLSHGIAVDSNLQMASGDLDLHGFDLILSNNGSIQNETESNRIWGDSGEIVKTLPLNAPMMVNPGNMGLDISSMDDLGSLTVRRGHKPQLFNGGSSIQRYFNVQHTGAPGSTADYVFHYFNAELNGLDEHFIDPWAYDSTWVQKTAISKDTTANFVSVSGVAAGDSLWTLGTGKLQVTVRVLLEGNYSSGGLMTDLLRSKGLIPLTEPYTGLGYGHVGSGGEAIDAAVLNVTGDNAIVDWVFLELRDPADSTMVKQTAVGLLQKDGDIVDLDGTSPMNIPNLVPGDYFLAVRHRNHLAIRSAIKLPLTPTSSNYDFTSGQGQAWNNPAITSNSPMTDNGGTFLLHRANNNGDSFINIIDFILAKSNTTPNQSNVYLTYDINLDGNTNIVDFIVTKSESSPNKSAHIE